MAKSELDDSDEATPVLEQMPQLDHPHSAPPSGSKKPSSSSSSSSTASLTSRALFTFPSNSKWDDAEKWLKTSTTLSKSGKKQQTHGFRKLSEQQSHIQAAEEEQELEEADDPQSEDKEKKMMIESSSSSTKISAAVSRFSFPHLMGKSTSSNSSNDDPPLSEDKAVKKGQLRIQKPSTDLKDVHTCFDFKQQQQQQQQPKSPTSLYESVACIAPGRPRSISMRDMGTEMTPIASQEPSRTATPLLTPTMLSPRVSPGRLRPPHDHEQAAAYQNPILLPAPVQNSSPVSRSVLPSLTDDQSREDRHSPASASAALESSNANNNPIATGVRNANSAARGTESLIVQQQPVFIDPDYPSHDLVEVRRTLIESRATAWEEAENAKYTARYEREEAKIVAWENHEKAKAEAELRRIEVKVERMRSHAHERMMNKLAAARRRAEELRAAAEAKKGEKAAGAAERAGEIRRSGRILSTSNFFCCCLAGV